MLPRPLLDHRWTSQSINYSYSIERWNCFVVQGNLVKAETYFKSGFITLTHDL